MLFFLISTVHVSREKRHITLSPKKEVNKNGSIRKRELIQKEMVVVY